MPFFPSNRPNHDAWPIAPQRIHAIAKPAQVVVGFLSLALAACTSDEGIIEVSWQYLNSEANSDKPIKGDCKREGLSQNICTCGLSGLRGNTEITYDFRTQLIVSESADCQDESCAVLSETFDCNRIRGAVRHVPISEEPYWMTVRVLVEPRTGDAFVPTPECINVPAPRTRKVRPGQVTDLAVVQFIVREAAEIPASPGQDPFFDLSACQSE